MYNNKKKLEYDGQIFAGDQRTGKSINLGYIIRQPFSNVNIEGFRLVLSLKDIKAGIESGIIGVTDNKEEWISVLGSIKKDFPENNSHGTASKFTNFRKPNKYPQRNESKDMSLDDYDPEFD